MKIAILTELFPPSIGGQEFRYAEIAHALRARGHSVHVYCIRSVPGTRAEEVVDEGTVHRYPDSYSYQRPLLRTLRRRPFAVLKYALRCRGIDPEAFDLFIFNQWPIAHVLMAPRAIRKKAIIDWCEYRRGTGFGFVQKYMPRLVTGNVANSEALADELAKQSGRPFEVIASGIFCSRYHSAPAGERNGILYLGRIEEHKNLPLMLSAYESLLSKGYTGRLRIAGDGPALPKLRQLVEISQIAVNVDVMGFVTEEQKNELLASSEVFLLTSRREGFPRVVSEAMASGLPVATVDYPENGATDAVRQYGIGVVTSTSPESIADGIQAVMAEWENYSTACISASHSLDWEVLINKLLKIPAHD